MALTSAPWSDWRWEIWILPVATPGNATISALGVPEKTSKNGRAITGVPSAPVEPVVKFSEFRARKK